MKLYLAFLVPILITASSGGLVFAAATTSETSFEARVASATADAALDFVKTELGAQKEKFGSFVWEKIKNVMKSISAVISGKIGVNIYEGGKLFFEFIVWLFESLAKFARWILTLF